MLENRVEKKWKRKIGTKKLNERIIKQINIKNRAWKNGENSFIRKRKRKSSNYWRRKKKKLRNILKLIRKINAGRITEIDRGKVSGYILIKNFNWSRERQIIGRKKTSRIKKKGAWREKVISWNTNKNWYFCSQK